MTIVESYEENCREAGIENDANIARILGQIDGNTSVIKLNRATEAEVDDSTFIAVLSSIESVMKQIVSIEMRHQQITDNALNALIRRLPDMPKVRSLDFQCCEISGESVKSLAAVLSSSNISSLVLSGNRLSCESAVQLGSALATSKLEVLELADCGLSADALIAIFSSVRSSTCCIKKLDVSGCLPLSPQQEVAYHIEDALKLNPKIERLHLRKMGLRDCGIERIAFGVRFTENLKYLDVSVNKLSRDSAALLSGVIEKLDVLDLSHNRIQSEGAANLAKSIEQKGGLKVLGLTKADIGDAGICAVLDAYQHPNSNLKVLLLWGNHFEQKSSDLLTSLMKSGKLNERNSDCRGNCGWHPDGTYRPAELSHHLRQFYWWTPTKGPEVQRAIQQQPGVR